MNRLEIMNQRVVRPWTRYRRNERRKESVAIGDALVLPPPPPRDDKTAPPERRATQLRLFLQSLGSVYSCFALYLSSRIDLLPAEFCREFALTPDQATMLPPETVQQILAEEFCGPVELTFSAVNLTPLRSPLLAQYHEADLANGIPVIVVIARPEFRLLEGKTGVQESLDIDLLREHCPELLAGNAVTDFLAAFERKLDFASHADKLELMTRDADSGHTLAAPGVYRQFSTKSILTLARSPQYNLHQAVQSNPFSTPKLANLVCQTWLQLAIFGHCFPVDPQHHHVIVPDGNHISFSGCDLAVLPKRTQENLWNYVLATTTDDPDRAATFLLKEMSHTATQKVDSESFRSNFRQSAYFGALEPVLGTDTNAFAQLVFQHWKTAITHGYTPQPGLLAFYRGLFSIARIGRKLSPTGDPLRHAIAELRTLTMVDRVRDLSDLRYVSQNIDKFFIAAAYLPRVLDDALTRAAAPQDRGPTEGQSGRLGSNNRSTGLLAFSLLIAAVFISQSPGLGPWTAKFARLVLMLAGLLVLRGLKD